LVAVDGQLVVLDQTPLFLLELRNDTVDRIFCPLRSVYRFSFGEEGQAFRSDDLHGHLETNLSIETAMSTPVMFVIVVEDHNFIA
jgi:hypothetical protein